MLEKWGGSLPELRCGMELTPSLPEISSGSHQYIKSKTTMKMTGSKSD